MKIEEVHKEVLRDIFVFLIFATIGVFAYKYFHPLDFPGLEIKLLSVTIVVGLIWLYLIRKKIKKETRLKKGINYIFQGLLVLYLVLLLMETIREGVVSTWLNLNYLLGLVIFFGVIAVLFPPPEEKPWRKRIREIVTRKDYVMIGVFGVVGGMIVWYKTKEIGWLSYLISVISGILIILLSILILEEDEE